MFSYTVPVFIARGEAITDPEYSNDEYFQYLNHFNEISFESPKEIESIMIQLTIPSNNRICNVLLYDRTIDELNSYPEGEMPGPVGRLQLTLWRDRGPEIITNF
jgi:hypothetical protein